MATFPKSERIKSRIVLEKVYNEGEMLKAYPFRLKFMVSETEDIGNAKIVVSVPKRLVKRAVKRNRIRRQVKEIYRLNKTDLLSLLQSKSKGLALFLIFTGKETDTFDFMEEKLKKLLDELKKNI
ncbi:MAG: ribonuclease P protein component [Crocinitomicaceae bacterium]